MVGFKSLKNMAVEYGMFPFFDTKPGGFAPEKIGSVPFPFLEMVNLSNFTGASFFKSRWVATLGLECLGRSRD